MKKVCFALIVLIILLLSIGPVYANNTQSNVLSEEQTGELVEIKKKAEKELADYNELYGSESYGMTAYILNKLRIYSIPFCFIGIAVGAIYQYVLGIRRLDVRDKGFHVSIAFITLAVIFQVLPLIYAIIVKGWRN